MQLKFWPEYGQVHCGSKENLRICNLWGCRVGSPSNSRLGTLDSRRTKSRSKAQATLAGSQKEYIFCARFALPWELGTTSWSLIPGGEGLHIEVTEERASRRTAVTLDALCSQFRLSYERSVTGTGEGSGPCASECDGTDIATRAHTRSLRSFSAREIASLYSTKRFGDSPLAR